MEPTDVTRKLAVILAAKPNHMFSLRWLTVTYVSMDRLDEARAQVAKILRVSPRASIEAWRETIPFKDRTTLERVLDLLRKAGLPETSKSTAS